MKSNRQNRLRWVAWFAGLTATTLLGVSSVPYLRAGGPLVVGGGGSGGFGPEATPFVWMTLPVPYTTDGGSLGVRNNATANSSVASMFGVWETVTTSTLAFTRTGSVSTTLVSDGNVSTVSEFNALGCTDNPIIYDEDGSLFSALGQPPGVIGFAGPCSLSSLGGINSARAVLNGNFRDGDSADGFELTDNEFDAVFIHEFGHFFGLDHAQINQNCLSSLGGCASGSDDAFGLPTMFPLLIRSLTETPGVHPARTLSPDDIAWVSFLYPAASFSTTFGTIEGSIVYSDGSSGVQGANVIARQVDDSLTAQDESRRNAVSVVSGYLFAGFPGNPLTIARSPSNSTTAFGSTDSARKGTYKIPGLTPGAYRVEVESINPQFTGGSRVGPVGGGRNEQIPLPGPAEFLGGGPESNSDDPASSEDITVTAGLTESNKDIILNGTPPSLDGFDATSRNETRATATAIGNGTHRFSLSPFTDVDFYSFNAATGSTVTVEIVSRRSPLNTSMDSVLELQDSTGARPSTCRTPQNPSGPFTEPCLNDDIELGVIRDSKLEFSPPSTGTFFIHVSEFFGDARADFQYDLIISGASDTAPDVNAGGTVNGASFQPGAAVAPGSIASVFGTNLASNTEFASATPLPTTLGGATMRMNDLSVPKFFASAPQVNLQVPWELAGQVQVSLTDSVGGVNGGGEGVNIAPFAPGLFATNQAGSGQGAILISGSGGLVAAPVGMFPGSRPATRGTDFIEIFCTGLGDVTNRPASGAAAVSNPLSTTTTTPTVTIGGVAATVSFSGLAPGFVGLYQVNVEVPATAPVGDAVNVVLTIGGVPSNTVTIAVQ